MDRLKKYLGSDVVKYMEISDSLINKAANSSYNVNLITLEEISENKIIENLLPLGWEKPGDVDGCSSNCVINAFNNYVHELQFGYSPYELELSYLIRKKPLSREEALEKLLDQSYDQISWGF